MYQLIKRPLVTEKNSAHAERGCYAFEVVASATKLQVREAIEKYFGVEVAEVRTLLCRNKARRTRHSKEKRRYWKKALVQLKPNQKISLFEGA